MQSFDITIIGGGLVGATLALALAPSHARIALVDARPEHHPDPRLFALHLSSCRLLQNLQLWQPLMADATAIHQVHVSWQHHFGAVRLDRRDINEAVLGYVIPAAAVENAIHQAVEKNKAITLFRPAQLTNLVQDEDQVTLTLTTGTSTTTLFSRLAIGADGADSTVRAQVNLEAETVDYQQTAIVTRTTLTRSHQHIAYERFVADEGAIAMLPLGEQECATIWTLAHAKANELMTFTDAYFLEALQTTFGYRLGRLKSISKRQQFPLRMVRAKKTVDHRVLLLGNAAHTLHPIAAQGFNLALYEVAILADYFKGKTIAPADLLQIHEQIQSQQAKSIGLSHRLANLFSHQSGLLRMGVQAGMIGLDLTPPLKKTFLHQLMGKAGRVPRLLLGEHQE